MKIITEIHFNNLVAGIIAEKQKIAEKQHEIFMGVSQDDLMDEVAVKVGGKFVVKREQPVKFSKSDINAVANNRFYRKTGLKLLMGAVIILLGLSMLTNNFQVINPYVYYGLCGITAIVFVYVYSSKQAKARKELWHEIGREEIEEQ